MSLEEAKFPAWALPILYIAAGGSTVGGVSAYWPGSDAAVLQKLDEIRAEMLERDRIQTNKILEVEYETEIWRLESQIAAMERAGENGSADYQVAVGLLLTFSQKKAELK